jgi:rRNA maturation endonuclease Nob1
MLLTSVFVIIAIGVLAFAVITRPLYDVTAMQSELVEPATKESLMDDYDRHLAWMRDLDIELSAAKIDLADYTRQKAELQTESENLLSSVNLLENQREKAGGEVIEHMITDRRLERVERSAGFCVKCGRPLQRSDLFCPNCGMKLK